MFRKKVQPKDEPRWIAYPTMAPTDPQDFPPQGGDATMPVKTFKMPEDWDALASELTGRPHVKSIRIATLNGIREDDPSRPPIPRVDRRLIGRDWR